MIYLINLIKMIFLKFPSLRGVGRSPTGWILQFFLYLCHNSETLYSSIHLIIVNLRIYALLFIIFNPLIRLIRDSEYISFKPSEGLRSLPKLKILIFYLLQAFLHLPQVSSPCGRFTFYHIKSSDIFSSSFSSFPHLQS